MYSLNGIKNGKVFIKSAGELFENTTKDINMVGVFLSIIRKKHPSYLKKIEEFYNKDITQINNVLTSSKDDLRHIEKDVNEIVYKMCRYEGIGAINIKTKSDILPKLKPETIEILNNGKLQDKVDFLLNYIKVRDSICDNNIADMSKVWESPSKKKLEGNIYDVREHSIGFIKKALLNVPAVEDQFE